MAESSKRAILKTVSLDFPSVAAAASATLTTPVSGAKASGVVSVSAPALDAGLMASGFVSAAGVVTVKVSNTSGLAVDAAAQNFHIAVTQ